jgi:hypothetical protein
MQVALNEPCVPDVHGTRFDMNGLYQGRHGRSFFGGDEESTTNIRFEPLSRNWPEDRLVKV